MTHRFWIKLYVEILDDSKLGTFPEYLKWRAIALFLAAGENGNDGLLPPVERLAWRLRLPMEKIAETLAALAQVGVVHETPQGWVVTNFAKRQAALNSTARSQYFRKRKAGATKRCAKSNDGGGGDSTSTSISSSVSESLEEVRVHAQSTGAGGEGKPADIFRLYEQNIGALTPMVAEALQDAEKSDGAAWVCAAIEEAVKNNVRSWRYCEAILRRWRRDGFRVDKRRKKAGDRQRSDGKLSPEQLLEWAEKSEATETA